MILLLICFVSLFLFRFAWFRFRLISFRILKFLFCFEAKQAKLGGQFCYVSLQFRFEAKFGDTLIVTLFLMPSYPCFSCPHTPVSHACIPLLLMPLYPCFSCPNSPVSHALMPICSLHSIPYYMAEAMYLHVI